MFCKCFFLFLLFRVDTASKITAHNVREYCEAVTDTETYKCSKQIIHEIGENAFHELNINKLVIQDNQLRCVHEQAFCETTISRLLLSDNQLSVMPNVKCIGNFLEELDLEGNIITQVDERALQSLIVFRQLRLRNNALELIDYNALCNTALQHVILRDNNLTSTPNFSCIYHSITTIDMYNNAIHEIPPDSFKNVNVAELLHLGKNSLSNVTSLRHLIRSNAKVFLDSNNLTCFDLVSIYYLQ